MLKHEITEKYEQLHAEYLIALVEYHNAYLKYIKGSKARAQKPPLRKALRNMLAINKNLIRSLTETAKNKKEYNKDKYQTHRTKNKVTDSE